MATERNPEQFEPDSGLHVVDEGGRELTIMEHLAELRSRMFYMAAAVGAGTLFGLFVAKRAITFLEEPAKAVYPNFRPQQVEPLEFVGAYFKVAILIGLII